MARFRVLGIPVSVDPWFFFGLFFVYSWSGGGRAGLFAAAALGVLTLVHELGHALTARRFGCEVAISLNLFVGWASYSSARPMSRARRMLVSVMGPGTQLGVAVGALALIYLAFHGGVGPDRAFWGDLWIGVSWAGVVIALLNLLPLWPLDGGHLLHGVLESRLAPRRALRGVLLFTLGALGAMIVLGLVARGGGWSVLDAERRRPTRAIETFVLGSLPAALWAQLRSFPAYLLNLPWFLFLFSGMTTVQTLNRLSAADRQVIDAASAGARIDGPLAGDLAVAAQAEAVGWQTGTVPPMPKGWTASPWLLAHLAARVADTGGTQAALARVVARGRRWVAPDPARRELAPLLAALAAPWPIDDPARGRSLLAVATHHAPAEQFLEYADRLYRAARDPEALLLAAGGLARRGHPDDAMAWLSRAVAELPDAHRVAGDPEFAPLHDRSDFQQLLTGLRQRAV